MSIAYFDCFSGASGDMILGALLDAGLPLDTLTAALRTLPLPDWQLTAEPVLRGAIGATLARVHTEVRDPLERHLADVLQIIDQATLPGKAAAQARLIFGQLAEKEAGVHRTSVESVHFHEVGAADAILDICGATTGLALLGIDHVYCSPLPLNQGSVRTAHGMLPIPAPATLALLAGAGAPTVPHPSQKELLTPTGAAILTTLASFEQPPMRVRAVGYGAGSREEPVPNVLRVVLAEPTATHATGDRVEEPLAVLECNLDDMNPQWYGHLFERLLAGGALDVTCTPVLMKKGRPGQVLSVLCRPESAGALTALLLAESTTLGVRRYPVVRHAAGRAFTTVETSYGRVQVKLRLLDGTITQATPEYEQCVALARASGVSLPAITLAAQVAAQHLVGSSAK